MGKTRRWCDEQMTEYVHPEGQETTVRDLPLLARVVRRWSKISTSQLAKGVCGHVDNEV